MSEVRLLVRESGCEWSGIVHGDAADHAIAALSADPATLSELEAACARFARPIPNQPFLADLSAGSCDEPHYAGVVVIDLAARLVVVDSTYSSPAASGAVYYHDGERTTDTQLRYHLAEDWLFISDRSQWPALADKRRRERAARPLLDPRAVFYGPSLLEFIARETFAAFTQRLTVNTTRTEEQGPSTDKEIVYDTLKEIHASWLLTPRNDLGGVCPRDIALESSGHLGWDLQDQCERWTWLGRCPPGLDKASFAFRYGGFGTHELVKYYDLVRELLRSCWERLVELGQAQPVVGGPERFTVGDFLTGEVPRLECVRDEWLDRRHPECHGRTPRSIIDRERARLPEGMSGHDAVIDADCPCCQMLADMPGPMFWHLDGSGMDDEFAFDISHRTREEWEEERRKWEEHNKRFNAEWTECERLGLADSGYGAAAEGSVWRSSFSVGESADVPLGVRLFGIGGHLAELIADIRGGADQSAAAPQVLQFIDQLNRDFGNLRELLQASEPVRAQRRADRSGRLRARVRANPP